MTADAKDKAQVKRYDPCASSDDTMYEIHDGEFVRYEDVEKLFAPLHERLTSNTDLMNQQAETIKALQAQPTGESLIEDVMQNRVKILEDFSRAYLAELGLKPSDVHEANV